MWPKCEELAQGAVEGGCVGWDYGMSDELLSTGSRFACQYTLNRVPIRQESTDWTLHRSRLHPIDGVVPSTSTFSTHPKTTTCGVRRRPYLHIPFCHILPLLWHIGRMQSACAPRVNPCGHDRSGDVWTVKEVSAPKGRGFSPWERNRFERTSRMEKQVRPVVGSLLSGCAGGRVRVNVFGSGGGGVGYSAWNGSRSECEGRTKATDNE